MPPGRRTRGSPPKPAFVRRFTALFEESGLSQGKFGQLFGVTQSYVSQILQGIGSPSRKAVRDLCAAYELDPEEWLPLAGYLPGEQEDEDERRSIAMLAAEEALWRAGIREPRLVYDTAPNATIAFHRAVERLLAVYKSEAVRGRLLAALEKGWPSEDYPMENVPVLVEGLEWLIQQDLLEKGIALPEGVEKLDRPEGLTDFTPIPPGVNQ